MDAGFARFPVRGADQAGRVFPGDSYHRGGLLHGCARAGQLAESDPYRFCDGADCCGNGRAESLRRARIRPLHAAHGVAAAAKRNARARSVVAVRDSVSVAVSALSRHRVDLPRGLRARGNPDASGGGPGRKADVPANHFVCRGAFGSESAANGDGPGRNSLLFWRDGGQHGALASVPVGGYLEDQRARQMADARHGAAYSAASRVDGLRQDSALTFSNPGNIVPMFSHAALNASLNGISALLLAGGCIAIRRGRREVRKRFMISAFVVSCAFLVSYLVYHYRVGHVPFAGQGWIRPVYFTLLISHTILAVVIVPLILVTLRRAWTGRFDKHRAIARWTLPLWFYVSVTGVIVYLLLYQIYAPRDPGAPVVASPESSATPPR